MLLAAGIVLVVSGVIGLVFHIQNVRETHPDFLKRETQAAVVSAEEGSPPQGL